jgi:hypothetical protein
VKSPRNKAVRALLALATTALVGAAIPATSVAAVDPAGCSPGVAYDASIPTWNDFFADNHEPDAVRPLGAGTATAGGGAGPYNVTSSTTDPTPRGRNLNKVLLEYADAIVAATADNPRVKVIKKIIGKSALDRPIAFYVVGIPSAINNLDGPNGDAEFWQGVRSGDISEEAGLEAAVTRPAFGWITATPHGDESAAGESIARQLYELAARTDCQNARRLIAMDYFLQLVRNPDGHDAVTRTTAWGFDPNRDFGTRQQVENGQFIPLMNEYPGLYFIDAHQQGGSAYFFPPNEDPVHHEISEFSLDTIQNKIGPALQNVFNSTSTLYKNYSQYDLFTPEYGDTVPSLIMGAAGMTYEKGNAEVYSKQVYDHYLAINQTIDVIANDKVNTTRDWVRQWNDPTIDPTTDQPIGAVEQGRKCELQPNKLVSPLHDELAPIPPGQSVCGYFYRPDQHTGDVASLLKNLQEVGVKVFKLNSAVTLSGVKEYGKDKKTDTLPAGTLYIPMAQGMKHWIQAVLGENPFIPYPYYYDVVTWSYGLQRGLAGDGYLTDVSSQPTDMTQIGAPDLGSAPASASAVYAFNTDSMQGLGLVADLLDKGVNVYRGKTAFDAGGRHYFTGAALVDGPSVAAQGVDLLAFAKKRETPVYGLDRYPVVHQQMTVPKIGVYTGNALIPSNPLYVSGTGITTPQAPGHCNSTSQANPFCEALVTLRQKDDMPPDTVVPFTSTQLAAGELQSGNYTALINANYTIAAGAGATALQAWVNAGGRYVGYGPNGATSGRNAGLTNLNTSALNNNTQKNPGSTFDADFKFNADPVAWGFDLGGWMYRTTSDTTWFDPATLPGAGAVPETTRIVDYGSTPLGKYGLTAGITGPGLIDGRPAVAGSKLGAGKATFMGFDPFYRSWKELDERLVLNAAIYPTTPELPADPVVAAKAPAKAAEPAPALTQAKTQEAAKPLPAAKLVKPKPAKAGRVPKDNNVQLTVKKKYAKLLKRAVSSAKLPKKIRRSIRYSTTKSSTIVVFKGVRTDDFHDRQEWVSSLMGKIKTYKVKVSLAQL